MVKEDTPKSKRGKRAKADIEQEIEMIAREENELPKGTSKARELARIQEQELIDSVKGISANDIARKFTDFNIEISKTMNALSDQIVCEIQLLEKLKQTVELEKLEIERLHKIDIVQTALDQLIEEYQNTKSTFENEIVELRDQWEEEKQQYEAEQEAEAEDLARLRKRESEEYEYKKSLERKKTQDKYEEDLRLRDKQNKEKQESLEKSWLQREEFLKSQEEELVNLRKSVKDYPIFLQNEIEKAVAEAIQRTEQKLAHQIELLKRDNDAEKRIADLKIKTLEDALSRQLAQANNMQEKVDEAKKQVQDIAVKAIEGASGAKAFQIALEQTKGRPLTV